MLELHVSSKSGIDQRSCGGVNENCRTIDYALQNINTSDPNNYLDVYLDEGKYKSFEIEICTHLQIKKSNYPSKTKPVLEDIIITLCKHGNKNLQAISFKTLSVDLINVNVKVNGNVSFSIIDAVISNKKRSFYEDVINHVDKKYRNITLKNCVIIVFNKVISISSSLETTKSACAISFPSSNIFIENSTIQNGIFKTDSPINVYVKSSTFVNIKNRKSIFKFNRQTNLWISDTNFFRNDVNNFIWWKLNFPNVTIINSRFQYNILSSMMKGMTFHSF